MVYGCECQSLWNKNLLAVASRPILTSGLRVAFRDVGTWGAPVFFSGLTLPLTQYDCLHSLTIYALISCLWYNKHIVMVDRIGPGRFTVGVMCKRTHEEFER